MYVGGVFDLSFVGMDDRQDVHSYDRQVSTMSGMLSRRRIEIVYARLRLRGWVDRRLHLVTGPFRFRR